MKFRIAAIFASAGALACLSFATVSAQAATSPSGSTLTFTHADAQNVSDSVLTIHFAKPLSSAAAASIQNTVAQKLAAPQAEPSAVLAAPSGAYLYCNHAYSFSDSDGNYTFQHKCGGTTGPWGYRLSTGLCSLVVSEVHELGMAWTRNGKRQGANTGHTEECRYQFHGNYNPDHDYDFLTYSDTLDFTIDIDGDVGAADVVAHGSFTSAGCTNGKTCGL
jgi:hypothetical protein